MKNEDKELEFTESLYNEAEEQIKEVYKEQKKNRDNLLQELALIMLTYTVLDGLLSLTNKDKKKEYNRLSNIILRSAKGQGTMQARVINDILASTVNRTFDFYSYNAGFKDVKKIIDNNFKDKHFSERVWENENEVAKHLHKKVNDFLNGKVNVNQIKKDIETTYNTNAYNAKRLVTTEVSRCSSNAFDRFCKEVGVKKVRYNATLDSRTCPKCSPHDGKPFDFDKKIELPQHALCRCFYIIEDDDNNIGEVKQAKKHDKKVPVTDVAINKVPYIELPILTKQENKILQDKHKELLKIAKNNNNSNEVLNILTKDLATEVITLGNETAVYPSNNPKAVALMGMAKKNSVIWIHNHPKNSTFSFGDWFQLIRDERIGAMTVVTNQGNVFMLNKNNKFDYNVFRDKLLNLSTKYDINNLDDETHKIIMDELLKFSSNNGLDYIKR